MVAVGNPTRDRAAGRRPGVVRIEVAEHGEIFLPLAGISRRMLAGLIDGVLLVVAGFFFALTVSLVFLQSSGLAGPAVFATTALFPVVGPLLFELRWRGQTPGKRILELRVVARDGAAASAGQIVLRNALRVVDFLPFAYALAVAAIFASKQEQRLGDLVAGTLLVREDADGLLEYLGRPGGQGETEPR